jgi:hypothetical protein
MTRRLPSSAAVEWAVPILHEGFWKELQMGLILMVVLVLLLLGAAPTWNHSRNWGYAPSGGVGLVLLIVVVLLLMGRL